MANKDESKRPQRTPLHKQHAVTATQREGYSRRYVNDVPGRIEAFKAAGWTVVAEEGANTSDKGVGVESQLGSIVKKRVNKDARAEAQYAYLMEIPLEWYQQDQAEKMKAVADKEAQYDPRINKQPGADYGSLEISKN